MKSVLLILVLATLLISCSTTTENFDTSKTTVRILNTDSEVDFITAYCIKEDGSDQWDYMLQDIELAYGDSIEIVIENPANTMVQHNLLARFNDQLIEYNAMGFIIEYEEGILRIQACCNVEMGQHYLQYSYWSEYWDED